MECGCCGPFLMPAWGCCGAVAADLPRQELAVTQAGMCWQDMVSRQDTMF